MRLGKYLSSLTKPELEELKENCEFTNDEKIIINFLRNKNTCIEISGKMNISIATVNRRILDIREKIERTDGMNKVPIWEKMNLTIEEAAEYSNIGIHKLYEMVNQPNCPFVLFIGKKRVRSWTKPKKGWCIPSQIYRQMGKKKDYLWQKSQRIKKTIGRGYF